MTHANRPERDRPVADGLAPSTTGPVPHAPDTNTNETGDRGLRSPWSPVSETDGLHDHTVSETDGLHGLRSPVSTVSETSGLRSPVSGLHGLRDQRSPVSTVSGLRDQPTVSGLRSPVSETSGLRETGDRGDRPTVSGLPGRSVSDTGETDRNTAGGTAHVLDADLAKAIKITNYMGKLFYGVVLTTALIGQTMGATEKLHLSTRTAVVAVIALELGGVVIMAITDVRRRLGEKATAGRLLSAGVAAFAVAFNWLSHDDKLLAGFFAFMSGLGYLVYLMRSEHARRDRLRAKGDLPPIAPSYELWQHWLRHPLITLRAKSLAKADARLKLYTSLAAAREEMLREKQDKAIAKILRRKIRDAVGPTVADLAVSVFNLGIVARGLADTADYQTLTRILAAEMNPAVLTGEDHRTLPAGPETAETVLHGLVVSETAGLGDRGRALPVSAVSETAEPPTVSETAETMETETVETARPETGDRTVSTVSETDGIDLRDRETAVSAVSETGQFPPAGLDVLGAWPAQGTKTATPRDGSMRRQITGLLDDRAANEPETIDGLDVVALTRLVGDHLDLDEVEVMTASLYVRAWLQNRTARVPWKRKATELPPWSVWKLEEAKAEDAEVSKADEPTAKVDQAPEVPISPAVGSFTVEGVDLDDTTTARAELDGFREAIINNPSSKISFTQFDKFYFDLLKIAARTRYLNRTGDYQADWAGPDASAWTDGDWLRRSPKTSAKAAPTKVECQKLAARGPNYALQISQLIKAIREELASN
jgi:hypothetical protein